jgi:F-type H+-transporting ATPase subunit delta
MADATTIARPYAEAVFQLADKSDTLSAWSQTLARMAAIAQNADVRACINNPKLDSNQLIDFFLSLSGDGLGEDAKSLVRLLVDNGRLELLPEITMLFEQNKNQREGVLKAEVQSAFALDDQQLGALVAQLETKYKRKVSTNVTVDKELIGGVRISVGDEVIDASVRGKLEHMRAALTS